jgi:cytochrome c-type biogenesis protein CcsB
MTNQTAFILALTGYVCATALALAYLVRRDELIHRLASLATMAGWACHTLALVLVSIETGRPPLGSLREALSAAVWVAVLLEMWLERRAGLKVLGAFALPVILLLGIRGMAGRVGPDTVGPVLANAWISVHIVLALVGIAAFVLNFAGAIMYLLQEHQLKARRPGTFYYRLPDLETLDRLTYRTLVLGFPFLTVALLLGAVWARAAWGSVFAFDPLAIFSLLAWGIYAAILAGRAMGTWRGRRAAYFAIAGFATLILTLGAGALLPGRHGS